MCQESPNFLAQLEENVKQTKGLILISNCINSQSLWLLRIMILDIIIKSKSLEFVNFALFGKSVFADEEIVLDYWSESYTATTNVPNREKQSGVGQTDEVLCSWKDMATNQRMLIITRSRKRQRTHSPLEPWFLTFSLRNCERMNLFYFKLPNFCSLIQQPQETVLASSLLGNRDFHASFCWILAFNQGPWFHYRKPTLKVFPLVKCEVPISSRVMVSIVRTDSYGSAGLLGSERAKETEELCTRRANGIGMENLTFTTMQCPLLLKWIFLIKFDMHANFSLFQPDGRLVVE